MMNKQDPQYLTTRELSERFRLTIKTLNKMRQNGSGPAFVRIGNRVRYPLSAVEAYERAQTMGA